MTRRDSLRALTGAALASPLRSQARQPNLVIIYADDMGFADVGFNGRREWHTPNLDKLAAQGTVFNRWYTGSPLCAPSRACLMTGKYSIHNGVRTNRDDLPASEVTLAEALKRSGYATALVGKWHAGVLPGGGFTHPLERGFDQTFGFLNATRAHEHYPEKLYRGKEEVPVKGYTADLFTDEALNFIRANRTRPYFLYLAYIEPHFKLQAPDEDLAKYRGKFKEKDPATPDNALYAAMIHRLDKALGRVVDALDENTLVVFTSDNGATFEVGNRGASWYHDSNRPFRGQKRSLEEGGIRMPAVVRWPGRVPKGRRSETLVHMSDVFPSLLAAAGGKPETAWKVDGVNLLDVWMGKAQAPDRTLFWEFNTDGFSDQWAAMRGDFKLLQIGENRYLYNLREDPAERRTLQGERADLFKQLRGELEEWKKTAIGAR